MGFGFILTIVLLGALLGLSARQALASTEQSETDVDREHDASTPHSHAM